MWYKAPWWRGIRVCTTCNLHCLLFYFLVKFKILDLMCILKLVYFKNIMHLKGVSLAFMIICSQLVRTKIDNFVSYQIIRQSTFSHLVLQEGWQMYLSREDSDSKRKKTKLKSYRLNIMRRMQLRLFQKRKTTNQNKLQHTTKKVYSSI